MIAVPHARNFWYSVLLIASAAGAAQSDDTIFFEEQLTEKRLVTLVMHFNPGIAELNAAAMAAASSIDPAAGHAA